MHDLNECLCIVKFSSSEQLTGAIIVEHNHTSRAISSKNSIIEFTIVIPTQVRLTFGNMSDTSFVGIDYFLLDDFYLPPEFVKKRIQYYTEPGTELDSDKLLGNGRIDITFDKSTVFSQLLLTKDY